MKAPKLRTFIALLGVALVAAIALAPAAPAANSSLRYVAGPADAIAGQQIRSVPFNPAGAEVQVELLNSGGQRITSPSQQVTVTLSLQLDGAASPGLTAPPVTTVAGLATFTNLSVSATNIPEISSYTLVASSPGVDSATSGGFDIWGEGTVCPGGGLDCVHSPATTDPVPDTYKKNNAAAGDVISTSTFDAAASNIDCDGYTELTNFSVWHESTQGGVLFVVQHTARDEMKNIASNGQAGVQICLAMSHTFTALQIKGQPTQPVLKDTDGDGNLDSFVGLVPKCPNKNPSAAAPCITRQYGDGNGGSFVEAWLPGSDPGKRS